MNLFGILNPMQGAENEEQDDASHNDAAKRSYAAQLFFSPPAHDTVIFCGERRDAVSLYIYTAVYYKIYTTVVF